MPGGPCGRTAGFAEPAWPNGASLRPRWPRCRAGCAKGKALGKLAQKCANHGKRILWGDRCVPACSWRSEIRLTEPANDGHNLPEPNAWLPPELARAKANPVCLGAQQLALALLRSQPGTEAWVQEGQSPI